MAKVKAKIVTNRPGPNRVDPTRTGTLVSRLQRIFKQFFSMLRSKLWKLIVTEDALRLRVGSGVTNEVFDFPTSPEKLSAFRNWLTSNMSDILGTTPGWRDPIESLIEEGFRKGAGRAFDDTNISAKIGNDNLKFYNGTREEFLRSAFAQPIAKEKIELVASRVFTGLGGITSAMESQIVRIATDGMAAGLSPRDVGRQMGRTIEGLTRARANTLARTEIIRAHAEGQLMAFEQLGVAELGVAAEWSTAGDTQVCDMCGPMEKVVLKVSEAAGLIPRHPNCRCAWIPANVRERETSNIRSKKQIDKAVRRSVLGELPSKSKNFRGRTVDSQMKASSWPGARRPISKERPLGTIRQEAKFRAAETAYKVAGPLVELSNTLPKVAGAVVDGAGFSPKIAKIAGIVATIGDYSVPGIPAGSIAVATLAHLKNPLASFNATKKGIGALIKFIKSKYRASRAGLYKPFG